MVRLTAATTVALAVAGSAAAASIASGSSSAAALGVRHGDDPHHDALDAPPPLTQDGHDLTLHSHSNEYDKGVEPASSIDPTHKEQEPEPPNDDESHEHAHAASSSSSSNSATSHDDQDHHHHHPTVVVPDAEPGQLVPVPWIPGGGAGTHQHKGNHAPVLPFLNETNLFLSSGP